MKDRVMLIVLAVTWMGGAVIYAAGGNWSAAIASFGAAMMTGIAWTYHSDANRRP